MIYSLRKFLLFRGHPPLALYNPGGEKFLIPFAQLRIRGIRVFRGLERACRGVAAGPVGRLSVGSEVDAVADGTVDTGLVGAEVGVHVEEDGAGIL